MSISIHAQNPAPCSQPVPCYGCATLQRQAVQGRLAAAGQHSSCLPFLIKTGTASSRTDSSLTSSRILLAVFLEMFCRGVTVSPAFAGFSFWPSPLPTSSFSSFFSRAPLVPSETQKKGEKRSLRFDCAPQVSTTSGISLHQGNHSYSS